MVYLVALYVLPASGITLAQAQGRPRTDWAVIAPGAPSRKAQPENENRTAQPEEAPQPQPEAPDPAQPRAEDNERDKAREILDAL